jgi:hypothetical protein
MARNIRYGARSSRVFLDLSRVHVRAHGSGGSSAAGLRVRPQRWRRRGARDAEPRSRDG